MRIPRIVKIGKGKSYINARGVIASAKKPITLRNGVKPLRSMFRTIMESHKWRCEHPLSLAPYFETIRKDADAPKILKYPAMEQALGLNENVGEFDFWDSTKSGFRTIIEWETGNISSSHRSLNKMCLALMGNVADAAALVVPSWYLYPHLTDRIGNIRELQPYFYLWSQMNKLVKRGLLAVIEVEQDELFNSADEREFLLLGTDGRSRRSRSRIRYSLRKKG
ncbi:MAG: hypothetical protein WB558_09415 [Terriglobales bacterium]